MDDAAPNDPSRSLYAISAQDARGMRAVAIREGRLRLQKAPALITTIPAGPLKSLDESPATASVPM